MARKKAPASPNTGPDFAKVFSGDVTKIKVATQVYQQSIEHLEQQSLGTKLRYAIADRYARAYAEYEALYTTVSKTGPVSDGPNGGKFFNLEWSALDKLNVTLAKFEEQLRLDLRHADISEIKPRAVETAADDYLD